MREYSYYNDVKMITRKSIVFKDGYELFFEECRAEWCKKNKIKIEDSYCVGERDILANPPIIIFFSKENVKVSFDRKGIFKKNKNEKKLNNLVRFLKESGFWTIDLT